MRKTLPVVLLAISTLLLAGCSASNGTDTSAACKGAAAPGKTSDSIAVKGDKGSEPTVKFSSPLKLTKVERTIVRKGSGQQVKKAETVDIRMVAYNGTTGKKLTSNGYGTGTSAVTIPITVDDPSMVPLLNDVVQCATVGSRVVTAAPVKEAFGSADPSSLGLTASDSIVIVADLVDIVPQKATGKDQSPKAGFPTVKLKDNGQPVVTIPKTDPPKKTSVEVLKKGDGEKIQSGDAVTVQYQGVIWRTGEVFDQSWGRAPATLSLASVVKGFATGLEGQTVGSQVVIVIPPADGYGTKGNSQAGIKGTDTLVFVVDILKTAR